MRLPAGFRYWLVITLLMLGFSGATALMLAELRKDSWTLANSGAQNLLAVLSQDIESTIRTYDRALVTVAAKLNEPGLAAMDPELQQAFLFDGVLIEPYFTSLLVLDRFGNVVRDAGALPPRSDNFADRAYFKAHANGKAQGLFISAPFQRRLTGDDDVLGLSRRIDAPDGSFAGVVVATLRLSYLRELFEQAHLTAGDAINLFSQDGIVLMRNPYQAEQIGRDLSKSENVRHFQAAPSGAFSGISAIDGVHRVYNFTHIDDLPLIVNVALSHDNIFAGWRLQVFRTAALLAVLCALTILLGFVLRREFVRRSRAEVSARDSEAQYRLLADHATDVILRLDRDMTRCYVSPASQAMLGFRPDELIGKKTFELIHPDDWTIVETIVRDTRDTGKPAEAIYRIKHRDGRYVWVEGRYSFLAEDNGFIVVLRDISRRKSAESKLAAAHAELALRADTDGLTGLANRRRFDEVLDTELDKAAGSESAVSLLLIDVDRFKSFNDNYGHQAGDECLRRVAQAIEGCIRPSDLCARYGGEEIAVVLPATDGTRAEQIGERIRSAVESLNIPHVASESSRITISIGCAVSSSGADEGVAKLIGAADRLLYEAKRTGRNKVLSDALLDGNAHVPPLLVDEPKRVKATDAFRDALDAKGSANFDMVARTAAELLHAPIGFVSLFGETEVTLVGSHGVGAKTFPRDLVFCAHTIAGTEPLIVHDALADVRFKGSPLVQGEGGLRFYAGAPLVDPQSGMKIGAVCVADMAPREAISASDRETLKSLSKLATAELASSQHVQSNELRQA